MKFFEIGAEVLVPKSTRAEVRLPGSRVFKFYGLFSAKNITSNGAKSLGNSEFQIQPPELDESEFKADRLSVIVNVQLFRISKPWKLKGFFAWNGISYAAYATWIDNNSELWCSIFVFIFIIWHLYKYCIEWKYQLYEYTLFANNRVSIYLCLSSGNFLNERDEKDPFHWHDEWKFWFEWIYSAGQRLLLPSYLLLVTNTYYSYEL